MSRKKCLIFISSFSLLFFTACSPKISPEETPSLQKIEISLSTEKEVLCLGEETFSFFGEAEYTMFINQVNFPEYGLQISYYSPYDCIYDEIHSQRIQSGSINPQAWSTKEVEFNGEKHVIGPTFFTPISVYAFSGSREEAIAEYEQRENIPHSLQLGGKNPLTSIDNLSPFPKFFYIRGENLVSLINEDKVLFYQWMIPSDGSNPTNPRQKYVLYDTRSPDLFYEIQARGGDNGVFPDLSVIDFLPIRDTHSEDIEIKNNEICNFNYLKERNQSNDRNSEFLKCLFSEMQNPQTRETLPFFVNGPFFLFSGKDVVQSGNRIVPPQEKLFYASDFLASLNNLKDPSDFLYPQFAHILVKGKLVSHPCTIACDTGEEYPDCVYEGGIVEYVRPAECLKLEPSLENEELYQNVFNFHLGYVENDKLHSKTFHMFGENTLEKEESIPQKSLLNDGKEHIFDIWYLVTDMGDGGVDTSRVPYWRLVE